MDTCSYCQRPRTKAGHDPCIKNLPGVSFACCGHGGRDAFTQSSSVPYLVEGKESVYGYPALDRMRELGGTPPDCNVEALFKRRGLKTTDSSWTKNALRKAEPVDA